MTYGVSREEALKRFAAFSGQLSTQCRTLSLGILAFAWALMTKQDSLVQRGKTSSGHGNLAGIAALVVLVLFADASQYYAALEVQRRCLKKMGTGDVATYDQDFWWDLQFRAFHAKFIGLAVAVVWLMSYLFYLLLENQI